MAYSQYRKHIQQSRRRSLNPYTPLPPIGSTTAEQDNSSCDEQIDDDVQSREHTEHDNNDEHAADDDNDESDSDSDDSPMMTFSDLLGMIEEHVSSELLDKADEIFWEIWRQICNHTDVIVRKIDMNQLDLKDVQVELSRHIEDLWDTNDMSDVVSRYFLPCGRNE
jgi:hypothetical protein